MSKRLLRCIEPSIRSGVIIVTNIALAIGIILVCVFTTYGIGYGFVSHGYPGLPECITTFPIECKSWAALVGFVVIAAIAVVAALSIISFVCFISSCTLESMKDIENPIEYETVSQDNKVV